MLSGQLRSVKTESSFLNRVSTVFISLNCIPMTKKPLNLKEIAKLLDVSTATVSNAFNRPDQLSKKLRERILKESAELGYFGPNLAARSLRKGQSDVIAVVLADTLSYSFSDPVASQFLQGISEVLVDHNKQLLLLSSRLAAKEQSSAESLPDGFIFYGAPMGDTFERIHRMGKPVMAVDFEERRCCSVNIDNEAAAYTAACHAMQSDSDNVAIISLRIVESERVCRLTLEDMQCESNEIIARQRLKGYLRAGKESKNEIPPHMIWHTPMNTPEIAEKAAHEALTSTPRPNVILCMSDVIALSVLRVANSLEISIPNDVRVIGFDDIPEASRSTPGLTTINQESIEKGRIAATTMLSSETHTSTVLPTRLMIRDTAATLG